MISLYDGGVVWRNGCPTATSIPDPAYREKTMAYSILRSHDVSGGSDLLKIKFDSLISHDITYVGIIQSAKASGLSEFPIPYAMTNCHNSLCAVGGTINADDHVFGLSAAKKYGGIFVPANLAVIHQYAREALAGCGRMILGSDSHTRYGPQGTLGVGEGGPELVKQLLSNTYDIQAPQVILIYLTGATKRGVGPHDVAIAMCGAVYKNGFVKNRIMEFAGPGVQALPMDYRFGIDVMTTEMACLSSIWTTDEKTEAYLAAHGRVDEYKVLVPGEGAYYDGMIGIDLSKIEPMAAMPFHPSEAVTIRDLQTNAGDILRTVEQRAEAQFDGKVALHLVEKLKNGKLIVDQGEITGCSGGMYDNIAEAAAILDGYSVGDGYFGLSIFPPSVPVNLELMKSGVQQRLMESGTIFKPCFCGPCFGAGDVPANNGLSIRHNTRNFPNREGSKPGEGQIASVILMDARSIAATARNHGILTAATEIDYTQPESPAPRFDASVYEKRVYNGWGQPKPDYELRYGPGIADWPQIPPLAEHLLLELASVIHDEVTTTDELIPSGETSSFRSNPLNLARFTLSRRDPAYVGRTEAIKAKDKSREAGQADSSITEAICRAGFGIEILDNTRLGSAVFARKPGDGSAREQAASCQRVLGGIANICYEFATKRYRSNCINWGILPFTLDEDVAFDYSPCDYVFVPNIRKLVEEGAEDFPAFVITTEDVIPLKLHIAPLTKEEKAILLDGCLMNYYANNTNVRLSPTT